MISKNYEYLNDDDELQGITYKKEALPAHRKKGSITYIIKTIYKHAHSHDKIDSS